MNNNIVDGMVSIILPVYNRREYIEECIDSVLKQSYQNFEIVIVDDGSTDDTYGICQSLASKETRIKLFASEHGGVSAARNIALDKASGEYIFFLDSDDVIHPFLFETFVTNMKASNALIGASHVARTTANNWYRVEKVLTEAKNDGEMYPLTAEEIIDAALGTKSPLGCIGGVMMHRNLIGDTRFCTDIYIGEDFYFIYENIIKGAPGVFLKQKWYYVRNHDCNSSWDYSFSGFWTRFYRRKLVWESEERLGRTNYANKQKSAAFGCYFLCAERNKPYGEDCRKMRKVLKEYKQTIRPALSPKGKIAYTLCIYLPLTAKLMYKLKKKLKSNRKTNS